MANIFIICADVPIGSRIEEFFEISIGWDIISRIPVVVFPIYILFYWLLSKRLTVLDYRLLYLTFLFWFLVTSIIGESGYNYFLIDIPIILLSFGVYLIKIPLTSLLKINNVSRFSVLFWVGIFILIMNLHVVIPPLGY